MTTSFAEDVLSRIAGTVGVMSKQIEQLQQCGYSDNFVSIGGKLMSRRTFRHYQRQELSIDKVICWEKELGIDGFYVYALSHPQDNVKGIYTVLF